MTSEQPSKREIIVFTDGGAKDNGKKSCVAGWGVYFSEDPPLYVYNEVGRIASEPSNQKAELYAIKKALDKLQIITNESNSETMDITVVTDSQYSIDCLTKWHKNWSKNGWKTYKGEKVKHLSIIKDALETLKNLPLIKWKHVNSHVIAPKDKSSLEYRLWYGNYKVDRMVSDLLSSSKEETNIHIPKGKTISIDWDGTMFPVDEEGSPKKKRKADTSPIDDKTVVVTW